MHNSSLTSFIRPICFYLLNTQKKISDKMTWGLGTSSWASSTSSEFVPAPPVEIGGGGGGGPGGGGEGRHGALRVKQVRSEVGWSLWTTRGKCFVSFTWLGLVFSHHPGDHSHPGRCSQAHLCGTGRSPAGPRPLS